MAGKTDSTWDDPYEPRNERRDQPRFALVHRVRLVVENPQQDGYLVGPANLKNLSLTGACASTKHNLRPFQWVKVIFPTDCCPRHMGMPKVFSGKAMVTRVDPGNGRVMRVGLRFSDDFVQDMNFIQFVGTLKTIAETLEARDDAETTDSG